MMKSCTWPATWSSGAKGVRLKHQLPIRHSALTALCCRYVLTAQRVCWALCVCKQCLEEGVGMLGNAER